MSAHFLSNHFASNHYFSNHFRAAIIPVRDDVEVDPSARYGPGHRYDEAMRRRIMQDDEEFMLLITAMMEIMDVD